MVCWRVAADEDWWPGAASCAGWGGTTGRGEGARVLAAARRWDGGRSCCPGGRTRGALRRRAARCPGASCAGGWSWGCPLPAARPCTQPLRGGPVIPLPLDTHHPPPTTRHPPPPTPHPTPPAQAFNDGANASGQAMDMMRSMGMGLLADQLADLKLGELLSTPPPGLDEAAALAKVVQFAQSADYAKFSRIVIDTAPTGGRCRQGRCGGVSAGGGAAGALLEGAAGGLLGGTPLRPAPNRHPPCIAPPLLLLLLLLLQATRCACWPCPTLWTAPWARSSACARSCLAPQQRCGGCLAPARSRTRWWPRWRRCRSASAWCSGSSGGALGPGPGPGASLQWCAAVALTSLAWPS
jgi:hypothetical protein